MTITIQCTCGRKLRAKRSQLGKTFPCPKCGAANVVREPQASPKPNVEPPPVTTQPHDSVALPPATNSRSSSRLPLILSTAALAISAISAAWGYINDPLGSGLGSYDFTTPQAALLSQIDMDKRQDVRAMLELQTLKKGASATEKRKTIKVHKESNYQGKKVLFTSHVENGIPKNDIATFEKHADSGYWFPAYLSTYDIDDKALEHAIEEWKQLTEPKGE